MAKKSSRQLSEQERAERRLKDRERLQRAPRELLSSEGWARWVRVRAMFHAYSAGNCMLIALQCHEREIVPQRVAGFRAWLKLERCVRKNEKALRILAPVTVKERDSAVRRPVSGVCSSRQRSCSSCRRPSRSPASRRSRWRRRASR
jgi:hypothetical protein